MNIFSELLYTYRDLKKLTQSEFVNELMQFSDIFSKLNTVTLSRWETSTTNPSIEKKQHVLKYMYLNNFLEDETLNALVKERYIYMKDYLEEELTKQYKHIIGNFPEFHHDKELVYKLRDCQNQQNHLKQVIQIESSMCKNLDYELKEDKLLKWSRYASTFAIISKDDEQHAGHFIALKIKNDVAEDIAFHRKIWFDLQENDFCNANENGTYFLVIFYARSPRIAAIMNVVFYRYLVENSKTVDKVLIYTTREDTILATKNYGIKMVKSGHDSVYGYKWYGMLSPLEDILFSSTVVGAVY
jgi:transcriptional regulator with XRE-family HTH domain